MKNKMKQLFGTILSLVLVLGLMPGMSLTALAEDPYAGLKNTTTPVHFDGKDWYLINYDSNTVTLLSKACVGASVFGTNSTYSGSTVETYVNNWYEGNIDAKTAVDGNRAFLLTYNDAVEITDVNVKKCAQYSGTEANNWWLSSANWEDAYDIDGDNGIPATHTVSRKMGVRPALKLDLSSVIFESATNTFTVESANSSPSKKNDSKEEKQHTHSYSWEDVRPATEDDNGEMVYRCSCGEVLYRVPTSAYYVFNKNAQDKIKNAKQGATVKIETSRWISFHKMVMEALADRPDVSLEVSFLDGEYKGNRVSFTIPAGTDTLSLLDENGFSGFLYLAGKFGMTN